MQKIAVLGLRRSGRDGATWTPCAPSATTRSTRSIRPCAAAIENGDIFFQHREACNGHYDALPAVVEDYMHAGQRQAGHGLPAVQLLRRARRRPRDRGHGLVLRRGGRGHRLPERPWREGGPGEGAPVPPVRRRASSLAALPATVQQDRRPGPHARSRARSASRCTWM